MQYWRFLHPRVWGFTWRLKKEAFIDRITGAPAKQIQVANYVEEHARRGDSRDVLRTIDRFATEERWLMNIGPDKGPLIQELAERLPADAKILELGAYCGYSSIMLANTFGKACRVTSIEINDVAVDSSRRNVEMAGLSDQISFIHGSSTEMIPTLKGHFDLVFLDHWKDLYKPDLQLIEQRELIQPGSIVVADNVGEIFNPEEYLDYVRNCGHYESENRQANIEYTSVPDAVEISVYRP
jgi:catechol O-methyltransferase